MEIINKMYKIDKKDLTFVNKKEYNEYNSSGYLISAIIKMWIATSLARYKFVNEKMLIAPLLAEYKWVGGKMLIIVKYGV